MQELTKKQKEAVESDAASTLVIAGPGTGKTHMLASRIQYLVEEKGIPAENILALTFTKSGAKEMKGRVISFLGTDGYDITANTFHGFASSLFEEYPDVFGYKFNLRQITDLESIEMIENIFEELAKEGAVQKIYNPDDEYYIKTIGDTIKEIKKEGFSPADFEKAVNDWQAKIDNTPDEEKLSSRGPTKGQLKREYKDEEERIEKAKELFRVYEAYQKRIEKESLFDYEDMILRAISGLENAESVKKDLQQKYKAVLVDEYQDTSGGQNRLLFNLIGKETKTFIVGDDDQAIYRFQGASIDNFKEFAEKYEPKIITLEDNFRSPQFLIDASLKIANANPDRLTKHIEGLSEKTLQSHVPHKDAKDVYIKTFETDEEEHVYIKNEIEKLQANGSDPGDIAVITITNKEQEELAEVLRNNGIPASVSGDINALDNPYVGMLFNFASAATNPYNDESLLYLLLHPATPITREDVWHILEKRGRKESIFSTLRRIIKDGELSDPENAKKTYKIIGGLSEKQTTQSGAHWIKEVMDDTGLLLWASNKEGAPYIIANLRALTDEAKRFQAGNPNIKASDIMRHFNSHIRLNIPLKPKLSGINTDNTVKITTAHKVKGQEFENVFITHAAHKNWSGKYRKPRMKLPPAIPEYKQDLSDERRVFYVSMTRAKKRLFITRAKVYTRGFDGMRKEELETHPAVFLEELSDYVPEETEKPEMKDVIKKSMEPVKQTKEEEKEIIKGIVTDENFALNPTALNTFLKCPREFLYKTVLRVPTIKNLSLTYGEAIHLALQQYFKAPEKSRSPELLMETVRNFVSTQSTLTEGENKKLLDRAEESLTNYYEKKLKNEPEPLYTEYTFPRDEIKYEGVRITGKADKITKINEKGVAIVDYKTSKDAPSEQKVRGNVKNQRESKIDLYRQLIFYKLLAEEYDNFNYNATAFILDFVDANKALEIEIKENDYKEFQETLKKVWESIQTLDFLNPKGKFPHCRECEYCKLTDG